MSHQDTCGLDIETPVQIPLSEGPAALSELEFDADITLHDPLDLTDRVVREEFRDKEGKWIFRAQTEKEKGVLRALDLMPKLPPKRGPGHPRKNA